MYTFNDMLGIFSLSTFWHNLLLKVVVLVLDLVPIGYYLQSEYSIRPGESW